MSNDVQLVWSWWRELTAAEKVSRQHTILITRLRSR